MANISMKKLLESGVDVVDVQRNVCAGVVPRHVDNVPGSKHVQLITVARRHFKPDLLQRSAAIKGGIPVIAVDMNVKRIAQHSEHQRCSPVRRLLRQCSSLLANHLCTGDVAHARITDSR